MEYLEIFTEINYWSYAQAFAKWILLFLLFSIILLIVGYKLKFFTRKTKVANVLVKSYYLLIPVYFLLFSLQYAPIKNTQNELNRIVDSKKTVIMDFTKGFLHPLQPALDSLHLNSVLKSTSIKEFVDEEVKKMLRKESEGKEQEFGIFSKVIEKIKTKVTSKFLSKLIETQLVGRLSEEVGINKKIGETIYTTSTGISINDILEKLDIFEIFKGELNKIFSAIYQSLFLTFGIGLLVPVFEISLSKILKY